MALTVNTNVSSLNAQRNLSTSQGSLSTSLQRLSSVVANQQTTIENLSASRGRIQDADFAKETANRRGRKCCNKRVLRCCPKPTNYHKVS